MTLLAFDHCTKRKCNLLMVTDYEIDRFIIDKLESWHKHVHNEVFYTLQACE